MTVLPLYIILAGLLTLLILAAGLALALSFYRKVEPGEVLVINRLNRSDVSFLGGLVAPVIHKAEVMRVTTQPLVIERRGQQGLICKDNVRADLTAVFLLRVNHTQRDVLDVARQIGCERASDPHTVRDLFAAQFTEALKIVAYNRTFEEIFADREQFKYEAISACGEDLGGFHLEDLAISHFEQSPLNALDPNNILDAKGIKKITDSTTECKTRLVAVEAEEARAEAEHQRDLAALAEEVAALNA